MYNNNAKKAPYQSNAPKKPFAPKTRPETVSYQKKFSNFEDGIMELTNLFDEIYHLMDSTGVDYRNESDAIWAVAKIASTFTPDPIGRKNLHFDFKISANMCKVKTDKFFAFGWAIKWDRETESNSFTFSYDVIGVGASQSKAIESLQGNGWKVFVPFKRDGGR